MLRRMLMTALALSGAAYAQEPAQVSAPTAEASSNRVAYDAAFFAQFNPRTALDMVRQTPGFTLNGGDDRRGFSGAVGNVLIDGLRPSAKSQSLENILTRIPATQVVRVELLRGADVAGDASGQSVLLNIVRTPTGGDGTWEGGFEVTSRHIVAPRGEASYSGRTGQTEYGIGADFRSQYRDLPGERRAYVPDGALTRYTRTPSPRNYREGSLNANAATPFLGGRIAATGQLSTWSFHADNDFLAFTPSGDSLGGLLTDYDEEERSFELGLNYDRDLGPWSLELVGLANRALYESTEDATNIDAAGDPDSNVLQEITREGSESILRGAISRGFGAQRIEFGVEGAVNTLDAGLNLVGAPLPPNANVAVEERRAEMFAVHTWRPAERWSIETRLAREASTLEFSGDATNSVELAFIKPSVQVSRSFGENNQVRARLYRDVGQLDFDDFVSSAAIADNLIAGGNPDLRPESSWLLELGTDLRLPGGAALSLVYTRHQITDAADVVQVIDTRGTADTSDDIRFDAPGNIGDGEGDELEINLTQPLAPLIPGGRLTVSAHLWRGEVTDPVTGQRRDFSSRPEVELDINFRQDLTAHKLAWGIVYYRESEAQVFRFNEVDTEEEGPWVDLFVETTALPNEMKLTFWAANILDGDVRRQRLFYAPDRNGPLDSYEERMRIFDTAPWFIVELSGRF